jgi:uncharacterized membrane protein
MIRGRNIALVALILFLGFIPQASSVQAQAPVVRAVLFYSPSCPHCLQVIEEVLPAWDHQYGSQLEIFGANTSTISGSTLYDNYIEAFNVPTEMRGVPALVVGDQYLVGSKEIPELFPTILEEGLSRGGVEWPDIPGLTAAMQAEQEDDNEVVSSPADNQPQQLNLMDKFRSDLGGNILAVIVLTAMLGSVAYAGVGLIKDNHRGSDLPLWLIPVLSLIGLSVSGYLAYVEFNQVEAVCGPVGNCNTVQQSSYATLFGVLPIGVVGVLGYIGILIIWLLSLIDLPAYKQFIRLFLWVITLFGVLFSIYLTFLEPFVIGASCIWCLSSAVIMTALFLAATKQLSWQDPSLDD